MAKNKNPNSMHQCRKPIDVILIQLFGLKFNKYKKID
jgi:hypothetical protein